MTEATQGQANALLHGDWRYVDKPSLEQFSREDWLTLLRQRSLYQREQQARQVLRMLAGLVPAICRHCRPAELQRQQGEHEDGKPTAHEKSLAATEFGEGSRG